MGGACDEINCRLGYPRKRELTACTPALMRDLYISITSVVYPSANHVTGNLYPLKLWVDCAYAQ